MALAAESDAATPPTSSGAACDALLAKLDELMDFLRFAKLPTADFHGVVRFIYFVFDYQVCGVVTVACSWLIGSLCMWAVCMRAGDIHVSRFKHEQDRHRVHPHGRHAPR